MAGRRSFTEHRRMTQTVALAEQLSLECSNLLELYKQKESFTTDVTDTRLVSVPHPSAHVDTRDKLRSLHKALLQCRSLMKRAIDKEEQELGSEKNGDYGVQRRVVRDRVGFLVSKMGELLKAAEGAAAVVSPTLEEPASDASSTFELKLWVFRVYKEVDYWTKTTIATLQSLLKNKDRVDAAPRLRSNWNVYR